ncbi:hypothetical protein SAMN02745229_02294 [Butyrivibrio fibrisolvens DSM 3071]|uniref:DUF4352 domain-containing protein n=1 Tax=Butyrivibrio fibrisolvens DSM 3071 TaxID=1121131 RepID=A0A1M5ZJ68_BUTFI|nr:hypothetical protein [Butyrivibrio fibrisolvens]SHI23983.1 hypothetical protein SAMN02745229_02294 [Butyrivibrio fibrisolvens DSM 3071]
MKKKLSKIIATILMLTVSMIMSACATDDAIPISKEENREEYDQVTTYAAELLMKYSYNIVDDLTYVAIKNSEKGDKFDEKNSSSSSNAFAGMAIEEDTDQNIDVANSGSDDQTLTDGQNTDNGNIDDQSGNGDTSAVTDDTSGNGNSSDESLTGASDDTSGTDGTDVEGQDNGGTEGQNENGQTQQASSQDTVVADDELSDLDSELGGLKLSFNGYSVMNAYPSMNAQGGVTAKDGEKVLVLNFVLSNPTSSSISLNILNRNATFKVAVNGNNVGYTKVTMLMNDLSSYVGTVSAGSEEQLVLLVIVPSAQASSISNIAVTFDINGKSYTVRLE